MNRTLGLRLRKALGSGLDWILGHESKETLGHVLRYRLRPELGQGLKAVLSGGLDLLYPPALYCICCGNIIDETRTYHLCDHCMAHIRWDGQPLRKVMPVVDGGGDELAGGEAGFAGTAAGIDCAAAGSGSTAAEEGSAADEFGGRVPFLSLCCTQYGLYERRLIFSLKYNGKKYIARDLAQIMADRLALARLAFDVIVPVPMFSAKERQRGFNHAALIGRYLARLVGKPCLADVLLRTENTQPMRGLSPTERKLNVKGKFAYNKKYGTLLEGKKVLLLDDFYTTGSTAAACYEALLSAQPEIVYFLAFAAK